jgi:RNA polymerase sigma-70 factor (ECF subfamily)
MQHKAAKQGPYALRAVRTQSSQRVALLAPKEMSMDDPKFRNLVARARAGDEDAVGELLRAFEDDVRTMVRVRLPRLLRTQFDSLDFVQAVWKSVLAAWVEKESDFENPAHFRGFLAGVTRNKVLAEYRRRTRTRKYDLGREEPLRLHRGSGVEPQALLSSDPTPSEEAQVHDRMDWLTEGRPRETRVVELLQQGSTQEEISRQLGVSDRTVRRIIEGFRLRWSERESLS